jgi:hypothetical protein
VFKSRVKRILATTVAATALAGGLGLASAGQAAAGVAGLECSGDDVRKACIENGSLMSGAAYTNFTSGSCTTDVVLWDETTGANWHQWYKCGVGNTVYGSEIVSTETDHSYHVELRVYWDGGSGYESTSSPSRSYSSNAG